MGSHPSSAPPYAPRRDDWGGLDRRLADDGCGIRHNPDHMGLLLGKVHAVSTLATATVADAAEIIHDICLCSGASCILFIL